jgi:hypothetical protein
MRIPIIAFILLLSSFSMHADAQQPVRDSVKYYQQQLGKMYRRAYDSLRLTDSARYYSNRIKKFKDRSKSYTSFMLFGETDGADFKNFNTAIAKDGFGPLSGPIWGFGLGVSHKAYNGIMIDFNYAIFRFNRTVKNGDEKITANVLDLLQLDIGYAVVNCKRFTLYPYAGLSGRTATLSFDKPTLTNSSFNSIAGIVQNNQSSSGNNTHLSYQAGLGIDWVIHEGKQRHGGTILFGKFGTDGTIGNENYKISGVEYDSGIRYGAWVAQLGFKFFGR